MHATGPVKNATDWEDMLETSVWHPYKLGIKPQMTAIRKKAWILLINFAVRKSIQFGYTQLW